MPPISMLRSTNTTHLKLEELRNWRESWNSITSTLQTLSRMSTYMLQEPTTTSTESRESCSWDRNTQPDLLQDKTLKFGNMKRKPLLLILSTQVMLLDQSSKLSTSFKKTVSDPLITLTTWSSKSRLISRTRLPSWVSTLLKKRRSLLDSKAALAGTTSQVAVDAQELNRDKRMKSKESKMHSELKSRYTAMSNPECTTSMESRDWEKLLPTKLWSSSAVPRTWKKPLTEPSRTFSKTTLTLRSKRTSERMMRSGLLTSLNNSLMTATVLRDSASKSWTTAPKEKPSSTTLLSGAETNRMLRLKVNI